MSTECMSLIQKSIKIDKLSILQQPKSHSQDKKIKMEIDKKIQQKIPIKDLLFNKAFTPQILTPNKGNYLHNQHLIPEIRTPVQYVYDPIIKGSIERQNQKHNTSAKESKVDQSSNEDSTD